MGSMHLLPAYWTTTNHKKRKKKKKLTASMEKSLREHEKFLKLINKNIKYLVIENCKAKELKEIHEYK